ncbi:MAG TPA: hypothetical protein VG276_28180 [Actinomycetes bacterium]|nr:hypothetical protein [Actinomycetes bacterium]
MTARQWVNIDPVQVSAYCADKADRLRDHEHISRDAFGPTWAVYLVLGDQGLVYQVTVRLFADRWTATCDHPALLRQREGLPIRTDQACSHIHAAAGEEAHHRGTHIPVPPTPEPPPQRPAEAMAGFYD